MFVLNKLGGLYLMQKHSHQATTINPEHFKHLVAYCVRYQATLLPSISNTVKFGYVVIVLQYILQGDHSKPIHALVCGSIAHFLGRGGNYSDPSRYVRRIKKEALDRTPYMCKKHQQNKLKQINELQTFFGQDISANKYNTIIHDNILVLALLLQAVEYIRQKQLTLHKHIIPYHNKMITQFLNQDVEQCVLPYFAQLCGQF